MELKGSLVVLNREEAAAAIQGNVDGFGRIVDGALVDVGNGQTGERVVGFPTREQALSFVNFVRAFLPGSGRGTQG